MGANASSLHYTVKDLRQFNGPAHHTDKYELMNRKDSDARLVVRRGQVFYMKIRFNQKFNPTLYTVNIHVSTADTVIASTKQNTLIIDNDGENKHSWGIVRHPTGNKKAFMAKIFPPVDAQIGHWKITFEAEHKKAHKLIEIVLEFYLIFNPWCSDDQVFLDSEEARQEHILSDVGLIWRGNYDDMSTGAWLFSQFDRDILDCAFYLIFKTVRFPVALRHDPILVARALSMIVNANTSKGVLVGNWDGDYSGGTSPVNWLGSRAILQKYYRTKEPVKFGQCWVFAGILATLSKTLGLPCRVITTFNAAHDTDRSLTVDYFVTATENRDNECNQDFVWNFHVWNECWMKRPDLVKFKDHIGWQAVDSTPPLGSKGLHKCGPAPLLAVKEGYLRSPHDSAFIFAEVNADVVYWRYRGKNQKHVYMRTDTQEVGVNISTKAVGSTEREDVTETYKYAEGSSEERAAMKAAKETYNWSDRIVNPCLKSGGINLFDFHLQTPIDITIGESFSAVLKMTNNDKMTHVVSVKLSVESILYTRSRRKNVKFTPATEKSVLPGVTEEVELNVSWEDYSSKLMSQHIFNISCYATVLKTNIEYLTQCALQLKKPNIIIKQKSPAIVDKVLRVKVDFTNPLPIPLTNAMFLIEGPGMDEHHEIKVDRNIAPGATASQMCTMIPKFEGNASIVARFQSTELEDVDGFLEVTVHNVRGGHSYCNVS